LVIFRSFIAMPFCSRCGKELPIDARFCLECGASVTVPIPLPSIVAAKQETRLKGYSMKIVLPTLVLILILSFSVAGYEFYVIQDQAAKIKEQSDRIAVLESKKLELENTIRMLNEKISSLESDKAELEKLKGQLEKQVSELDAELAKVKPKRPSYEELEDFLSLDKTSEKPYAPGFYVCADYAIEVRMNARQQGLNLSIVFVWWKTRGSEFAHALNAAYLDDGTLIWIEPQRDRIYSGSIEQALEQDFNTGEYYTVNPKITELLIIW